MIYTAYVPHGINSNYFYPIAEGDPNYDAFIKFKDEFLKTNNFPEFIIFWNNRNIRRKHPGDVILSYVAFMKSFDVPPNALLFMHTQISDENGTDLGAVVEAMCQYPVLFSDGRISVSQLNFYYNLADVTINIASNEGFGLSGAESIMAGTPIINNVTGGLQDQCRFSDSQGNWIDFSEEFSSNHTGRFREHGEWAMPVFPAVRTLQGSVPTPYIFDDIVDYEDVGRAIKYWHEKSPEERKKAGVAGRNWALSSEAKFSATEMGNSFIKHLNYVFDNWKPQDRFSVSLVPSFNDHKKPTGILWE